MQREHASTKRIVLTFFGLAVGLLALLGLIVAISTALAPPTPPDTAPAPVASATPAATLTPGATAAPAVPQYTTATPAPAPTDSWPENDAAEATPSAPVTVPPAPRGGY